MRSILPVALIAAALGVAPTAIAQEHTASPPSVSAAAAPRAAARVGPRAQAFATTIQGNALTSTNGHLANTTVRLRDARFGRIVDSQVTDKSGLFAFRNVDPGSYIVEVMGSDQASVLAASRILNVNSGDVVSAVVKLPFRLSPFAGILGGNSAATPVSAAAVVTQAAANGVLAVIPPAGAVPSCPVQ